MDGVSLDERVILGAKAIAKWLERGLAVALLVGVIAQDEGESKPERARKGGA